MEDKEFVISSGSVQAPGYWRKKRNRSFDLLYFFLMIFAFTSVCQIIAEEARFANAFIPALLITAWVAICRWFE